MLFIRFTRDERGESIVLGDYQFPGEPNGRVILFGRFVLRVGFTFTFPVLETSLNCFGLSLFTPNDYFHFFHFRFSVLGTPLCLFEMFRAFPFTPNEYFI